MVSDDKLRNTIAFNLKRLRKASTLSRNEIATILMVNPSTYRSWENAGRACPKIEMLMKIARIYRIDIEELLYMPDELCEIKATYVCASNNFNSDEPELIYGERNMAELSDRDRIIVMKSRRLNKIDFEKIISEIDYITQ